ncbi:MAG: 3-dehydroquinate synthase [Alphaproteobacteria bacterium]|jgi:3-dehydroquinate synthase|nr:3-dehydroquinate synthase [Alphaproteobacteria bacterium]
MMAGSPEQALEQTTVRVDLAERSYDIIIGENLLLEAGTYLAPVLARPRVAIITDATVAALHLTHLQESLDAVGIENDAIIIPAGEGSKNFTQLQAVLDQLLALRIERRDTIIALGGGVVGDLAGFAAAILRRGVDFIQIPTTLLSQVDSSVGGKTAVNVSQGKNLVGAFYQPRLVLADVTALSTLPARELRAGYGEVVKYGLIDDFAFFEWLEMNGAQMLAAAPASPAVLAQAVAVSCRSKAAIVARDERETGDRALLNLGHTFAHALEAEGGYDGRILHGEAVSIGLNMAFTLSSQLGLCPSQDSARVCRHLAQMGLPTDPSQVGLSGLTADVMLEHMRQDKKVSDGQLTFILAKGIGQSFITRDVPEDAVKEMLDNALSTQPNLQKS